MTSSSSPSPWSVWSSRIFRGARESAPYHDSDRFGLARSPTSSSSATAAAQNEHLSLPLPLPPPHLRSPSSASPVPSASSSTTIQPSRMVSTPHQYSSSHDMDDEGECPVCLEPLSFSFRLPGEKPHIVPECGHALHEVCQPTTIIIPFRLLDTSLGLL